MSQLTGWLRMACFLTAMVLVGIPVMVQATSVLFVTNDTPPHAALLTQLRPLFTKASTVKPLNQADAVLHHFVAFEELSAVVTLSETASEPHRLDMVLNDQGLRLNALCELVDVVVAVGPHVVPLVRERCRRPTLIVSTPRLQADEFIAAADGERMTAIYLEADPLLNLRLIDQVVGPSATVGVLVSARSQQWLAPLETTASELGLKLETLVAQDDQEAVRSLRQNIQTFDALLLMPDDQIINGWSLKPILLMTARHYVPVFGGATENYVKAGTTAAVVANFAGQIDQIKSFIRQLANGGIPEPEYPTATQIVVNPVVARALSIKEEQLVKDHGN